MPLASRAWPALAATPVVYVMPWALGAGETFELLLVPPPATPPLAPAAATVAAFLLIAGNLLRRVETQALMQANAWIEDEIRKVANLRQLLHPAVLRHRVPVGVGRRGT